MNSRRLTLMAVHAHPDDEVTTTGGVLARYAAEGHRTVVVTCTDGGCGDAPGGVKWGEPGHDPAEVARIRRAELAESCAILGVTDLELLGYADSGMIGWSSNDAPGAFWATPVEDAAQRLAALFEKYRPDVVVTYDANGFYGHPDHIQAHRITMAAVDLAGDGVAPAKVYETTYPLSAIRTFAERMRENGADWEETADQPEIGLPDEDITTWVDTRDFAEQKYRAFTAHASQPEIDAFLKLGIDTFTELLGTETFVRVRNSTGYALDRESDLFAGLC